MIMERKKKSTLVNEPLHAGGFTIAEAKVKWFWQLSALVR